MTSTETRDERKARLEAERLRLNGAWANLGAVPSHHLDTGRPSAKYAQKMDLAVQIDNVEIELARISLDEAEEARDAYLTEFDPEQDEAAVVAARETLAAAERAYIQAQKAAGVARVRRSSHRDELRHRERKVADARAAISNWSQTLRRDQNALEGVSQQPQAIQF